ncbi:MAG: UvrD-helicase domain-containing protein, partial [Bacteroidales bacterium]|nr:UvrD-helicase domain-containing protein [Candidatus Sodaliphilus fimicaballi]
MANFLSRIFRFGKKRSSEASNVPELIQLCQFEKDLDALLLSDKYIARSDYKDLIEKNASLYEQFKVLYDSNKLEYFCRDYGVQTERFNHFLSIYEDLTRDENSANINAHNEKFLSDQLVSEKSYLDEILSEVDSNIKLDDEQRKVVLWDEDYTLVIAGAGAGKTTTVSAKVKYLVERKGIR